MSRRLPFALAALLALVPAVAWAQAWPARQPIRVIVPFTAGSATDIIARTVMEQVSTQLGQAIVVENRWAPAARSGSAPSPGPSRIKLILDNHSAHISKETKTWLAAQPAGRFEFTFTPKHGSWLNLVEGFFSKFARSVLRHIRVTSKHELKQRIMAGIDDVNRYPVVHTWSYKLAEAA